MKEKCNKGIIIFIIAVMMLILFWYLYRNGGDIKNVKCETGQSTIYTDDEINSAMNVVIDFFHKEYKGCKLTKLWYDEQTSVDAADEWAKQYKADEAIILYSDFKVGKNGMDLGFSPNENVTNWSWILIRDSKGKWRLKNWGEG